MSDFVNMSDREFSSLFKMRQGLARQKHGEIEFKKKCIEVTREKYGAKSIYIQASAIQEPGLPDVLIWSSVWCGLIEFKSVRGSLRPIQKVKLVELNKRRPHSAFLVKASPGAGGADAGEFMLTYYIGYRMEHYRGKDFDVLATIQQVLNTDETLSGPT